MINPSRVQPEALEGNPRLVRMLLEYYDDDEGDYDDGEDEDDGEEKDDATCSRFRRPTPGSGPFAVEWCPGW
jgi:hypothetical protein